MGVSNGYDIGVNGRDLILKTSGKIYVKVADKFYELDFRNEKQKTEKKESSENKIPDVVLLDTLTKENYPGDNKIVINNDELYITKGGSYKKVIDSAVQKLDTAESINYTTNDLFVQASNNVWKIGESVSGHEIEMLNDPNIKWNDYLFFNSIRDYYFDDIYGDIDDYITFWDNIFFNVTEDDPKTWVPKNKSEIENTILTNIYKNQNLIKISDFEKIYKSFWYSEDLFEKGLCEYIGPYATITIDKWNATFFPQSKIVIGNCNAIVTAVIGDSVLIKFKDENITLDSEKIQDTASSIIIYKKEDVAFLDVANSGIDMYNFSSQPVDGIRVRIGNLNTLSGHSGIGAVFNENVTIKNGPFLLNNDGSGSIGNSFHWDVDGNIFGDFVDSITNVINELSERIKILETQKNI